MHLKRSLMPTTWPIPRKNKGKRFMSAPSHSMSKGISILFVLRDILNVANTKKEAKKILLAGNVKINGIVRKDEAYPVQVLDTISLEKLDKYYRLQIVNKKYSLKEISSKEIFEKIVKISGKKSISKDKNQINLEDGSNILTNEKCNVGDSVVFNSTEKKIIKVLPLKEKAKVEIISGKHAGKKGELKEIKELRREKVYLIKLEDGQTVELPFKTILVIA